MKKVTFCGFLNASIFVSTSKRQQSLLHQSMSSIKNSQKIYLEKVYKKKKLRNSAFKRSVAKVPNLFPLFSVNENF